MRGFAQMVLIVVVVVLGGCSGGWRQVALPESTHAPRPGQRVEILRGDGAVRIGTLTAVDGDSLYSDEFAMAWQDVADVRIVAVADEATPTPGRKTRVELRDGRKVEGYLVAIEAETVVLADEPDGSEPTRVPRATVESVEQAEQPPSPAVVALGTITGFAILFGVALLMSP